MPKATPFSSLLDDALKAQSATELYSILYTPYNGKSFLLALLDPDKASTYTSRIRSLLYHCDKALTPSQKEEVSSSIHINTATISQKINAKRQQYAGNAALWNLYSAFSSYTPKWSPLGLTFSIHPDSSASAPAHAHSSASKGYDQETKQLQQLLLAQRNARQKLQQLRQQQQPQPNSASASTAAQQQLQQQRRQQLQQQQRRQPQLQQQPQPNSASASTAAQQQRLKQQQLQQQRRQQQLRQQQQPQPNSASASTAAQQQRLKQQQLQQQRRQLQRRQQQLQQQRWQRLLQQQQPLQQQQVDQHLNQLDELLRRNPGPPNDSRPAANANTRRYNEFEGVRATLSPTHSGANKHGLAYPLGIDLRLSPPPSDARGFTPVSPLQLLGPASSTTSNASNLSAPTHSKQRPATVVQPSRAKPALRVNTQTAAPRQPASPGITRSLSDVTLSFHPDPFKYSRNLLPQNSSATSVEAVLSRPIRPDDNAFIVGNNIKTYWNTKTADQHQTSFEQATRDAVHTYEHQAVHKAALLSYSPSSTVIICDQLSTAAAASANTLAWNDPSVESTIMRMHAAIRFNGIGDHNTAFLDYYPRDALIKHLSLLQCNDDIQTKLTKHNVRFLKAVLPALNQGMTLGIYPTGKNDSAESLAELTANVTELFRYLPSHCVLYIPTDHFSDQQLRIILENAQLLKPGTKIVLQEFSPMDDARRNTLAEKVPHHCCLLVNDSSKPTSTKIAAQVVLRHQYLNHDSWLNALPKDIHIIHNQSVTFDFLAMKRQGANKPYLMEDLTEQQIQELRTHFNQLEIGPGVSKSCIEKLSAQGFRLSYAYGSTGIHTTQFMSGVAHRNETRKKASPHSSSSSSHQPPAAAIPQLALQTLRDLPITSAESATFNAILHETPVNQHNINCVFYSKRAVPQPAQPTVFILASFAGNTLMVTPTPGVRQIVVMTKTEYDSLGHDQKRLDNVDYLVINSITLPHDSRHTSQATNTITSRYRAALMFAYQYRIDNCLVCDGRTEHITLRGAASPLTTEHTYQQLKQAMDQRHLLAVGMASDRSQQPNTTSLARGSVMWNISQLRHQLPSISQFMAILPEQANAWRPEYYAQHVLRNFTANPEATGIIDPNLMRMHNSTSATYRETVSPSEMSLSREHSAALHASNPELAAAVERTIAMQNGRIYHAGIQRTKATKIAQKARLGARNLHMNPPKPEEQAFTRKLGKPRSSHSFQSNLKRSLKALLDKKTAIDAKPLAPGSHIKKPYPHQWQAVQMIHDHLDHGAELNALLHLATGTGKTIIQAIIALAALASGNDTVVMITPYRHLATQTYNAIRRLVTEFPELAQTFAIDPNSIYKVFSEDDTAFNAHELAVNEGFNSNRRKLLIACAPSFKNLLTHNPSLAPSVKTLLVDEAHLLINKHGQPTYLPKPGDERLPIPVMTRIDAARQAMMDSQGSGSSASSASSDKAKKHRPSVNMAQILGFQPQVNLLCTATPRRKMITAFSSSRAPNYGYFRFNSTEAIRAGKLAPLRVDKLDSELRTRANSSSSSSSKRTNHDEINCDAISSLVINHRHPDGRSLRESKGIIFVQSQPEAQKLQQHIAGLMPTLPCYKITSQNGDRIEEIERFKSESHGIAIAVDMLAEGFDDPALSYAIIARQTNDQRITQMVGRILRKNRQHPNPSQEVGLVICSSEVTCTRSCYPTSFTIPRSYQSAEKTLERVAAQRNAVRDAAEEAAQKAAGITPPTVTGLGTTPNDGSISAVRAEIKNDARKDRATADAKAKARAKKSFIDSLFDPSSSDNDESAETAAVQAADAAQAAARATPKKRSRRRAIDSDSSSSSSEDEDEKVETSSTSALSPARKRSDHGERTHNEFDSSDDGDDLDRPNAASAASLQPSLASAHPSLFHGRQRTKNPFTTHAQAATRVPANVTVVQDPSPTLWATAAKTRAVSDVATTLSTNKESAKPPTTSFTPGSTH